MAMLKAETTRGKFVQVGRAVRLSAVGRDALETEIVGKDQHNVGLGARRGRHRQARKAGNRQ